MASEPAEEVDVDDLREIGVAPEEIARLQRALQQKPTGDLDLWKSNVQAVQVFAAMSTQWIVGGMGGVVGFRYESLPLVFDTLGVKARHRREAFDAFRVMEREAVSLINERKAKKA